MNRKSNWKWLLTTLLAVSSTTLSPAVAHAQQIKGSFTLPYTIHWGTATLPAGHYTFAAQSSRIPFLLTVRGERTSMVIMMQSQSTPAGNRSTLSLTRVGNQTVVSALQLAPYGARFEYGNRHRRLAQEAANYLSGTNEATPTNIIAQASTLEIPMALGRR